MVSTRSASDRAKQRSLEDSGVSVKGTKKAAASKRRKPAKHEPQDAHKQHADGKHQQSASADEARAKVESVDTGEDPQAKLQKDTRLTGLKGSAQQQNKRRSADRQLDSPAKRSKKGSAESKPAENAALQGKPAAHDGKAADQQNEPASKTQGKSDSRKSNDEDAGKMQLDKGHHHPNPKGHQHGDSRKTAAAARAEEHPGKVVKINRAPVLTLWVKKVAEREGFDEGAALTFGKAVSGMLAQSKGRSIGIYEEKEHEQKEPGTADAERAHVFGMRIKVTHDGDQLCAAGPENKALNPGQVKGYLHRAFGDDLPDVEAALEDLASAVPVADIGKQAYHLYEQFRPTIASGKSGWGQKADLKLGLISALADEHRQ